MLFKLLSYLALGAGEYSQINDRKFVDREGDQSIHSMNPPNQELSPKQNALYLTCTLP